MYCLGVDLGTTFSAAAVASADNIEVFTLGTVAPAIPSVVVLRADGEVLVGEAAERRALTEPGRTAREFKRRLGDPTPLVLAGTPYGAEALMARLLRWIVDAVVQRQGGKPELIVVTHPANYGPYKLDLLREMVRLADVGPVEYLTEPEAAAINYAEHDRLEPGQVVAVYDFGGGTFDAAVLRKTETGFELLGRPEGMERLGGIDFDHAVFSHVDESTGGQISEADTSDPATRSALARLRADCRAAKESLSTDTDVAISVMLPGLQTEVRLTRQEFEAMVRPRIAETVASLERAIRSSGVEMSAVDRILLVGGSSRIPLVAEMIKAATGRPTAVDAHPKFVIALGAARFGTTRVEARPLPAAVAAKTASAAGAALPVEATPVAGARTQSPRRIPKAAVIVGALLIVAVAAGGVFALTRNAGQNEPTPSRAVAAVDPSASQTARSTATSTLQVTAPASTASASAAASAVPGNSLAPVAGTIATFAGGNSSGNSGDGGSATTAQIGRVGAVAVGSDGAVYIADYNNGTVRVVHGPTIAPVAKGFNNPGGIAVDTANSVYVADTGYNRIVRIDVSGQTTTIAGQTNTSGGGGDGGPATKATLWAPIDVAVDGAGNVYVADSKNNRIRKIDSSGTITTVAGKGPAGFGGDGGPARDALLSAPAALAVTTDGVIYIADSGNGRIRKVDAAGNITTVAGNGNTSYPTIDPSLPATQAALHTIAGLALDPAGNVYAVLFPERTVIRLAVSGGFEVVAGGGSSEVDGVPATQATWSESWGIAIDPHGGTLYIADGPKVLSVAGVGQGG